MPTRFEPPRAAPLAYQRPSVYVTTTRTKLRVAITGLCACLALLGGAAMMVGGVVVVASSLFAAGALLVIGGAIIASGIYNLVWSICVIWDRPEPHAAWYRVLKQAAAHGRRRR